ncbi:MAG: hypothetical protein ACKO7M_13065 [Acinetobacter junii]
MVLFLNLLVPFVLLVIAYFGYKKVKQQTKTKDKFKFGFIYAGIGYFFIVVYGAIQPSYLPKGTAPAMSKVPIEQREVVLQDRLLKPMSEEDRQKRVDEILTVRDEVKQVLEQNKKVD